MHNCRVGRAGGEGESPNRKGEEGGRRDCWWRWVGGGGVTEGAETLKIKSRPSS